MRLKFQSPSPPLPLPNRAALFGFDKAESSPGRRKPFFRRAMANFIVEKLKLVSKLKALRWVSFFLGIFNLGIICLGGYMMSAAFRGCERVKILPIAAAAVTSAMRILSMIGTGIAQQATATTIVSQPFENSVVDAAIRRQRRIRYKQWLWWTRFGMTVTILQFAVAMYLVFVTVKYTSYNGERQGCFLGQDTSSKLWRQSSMVLLFLVGVMVVVQILAGTDVLKWRSFYATHDSAWKAHYREVFDHGIREVLCCLGRVKYLTVLEEDEVYSVARLLGDLVAYRASGTGHLELLAGLALLQRHKQAPNMAQQLMEAPESQIQEAATFHPFAEAAYTGPLLDFGRNPVLFPCAWLYRQGVLSPWSRSRRPVLEGDNWWRGHAAAFLNYVNISPEALRRGRVSQAKREAAYFVVVIHHLRTVVIAVRGTETPEDLLTDGLCKECAMSMDDLDGLINSNSLAPVVRRNILSSFPHYGHSGILEAARELFMQLDGNPLHGVQEHPQSKSKGFLSSLLGDGCECQGYHVRIVGHSLGGAIAAVLGIRLYSRYPNLHVYAYGALPCVDSVVSEGCSSFVTSIIYNDEFSARLSVNSILRLRAAAITALSEDSSADSAMICKFARRLLLANKYQTESSQGQEVHEHDPKRRRPYGHAVKGGAFLCAHAVSCVAHVSPRQSFVNASDSRKHSTDKNLESSHIPKERGSALLPTRVDEPFVHESASHSDDMFPEISIESFDEYNGDLNCDTTNENDSCRGSMSQFISDLPSSLEESARERPEMYLPGFAIHIVPEQRDILSLWSWKARVNGRGYRAYVADKESFKDIIVSPSMFLDHLPWRCHYALQRVLETRKTNDQLHIDLLNESYMA